jgi:hypothetical protein
MVRPRGEERAAISDAAPLPASTLAYKRRVVAGAGAVALAITVAGSALAGAAGIVPPANPAANLVARPAYSFANGGSYGRTLPSCWRRSSSGAVVAQGRATHCVAQALAATDRAHHAEGLGSVSLPRNFAKLTAPEQLLVLTDLERVSRGEPPVLGLSPSANAFALLGAKSNSDPSLPANSTVLGATGAWASNYAAAVNTLDANYAWMYTDGWAGPATWNYDCTSAHAPGCWGHRDNILLNDALLPCYESSCDLVMGAGYVPDGYGQGFDSYTELIVQVSGATPALSYTWSQAVAAGAKA